MKWFKHYTKAHDDRAIEKLIIEYGVAGYGLYMYCLEIIAGSVEPDNITFELEPDAAILARRLGMDTLLVEKIMHSCVDMGLFGIADNGRITCFKLTKYIDMKMTSNPQMREIFRKSTAESVIESQVSHKSVTHTCDQIRLEEIRLDKSKEEKEALARFVHPKIEEVAEYCKERGSVVNPEKWIAHYESNGWRVGKNPMKDWRAAVRTWEPDGYKPLKKKKETCPYCGHDIIDGLCRNGECPQWEGNA